MQEEVENRTLTLVVSGTKFTGRMFKAAISNSESFSKQKGRCVRHYEKSDSCLEKP